MLFRLSYRVLVRSVGIEPTFRPPEGRALSIELRRNVQPKEILRCSRLSTQRYEKPIPILTTRPTNSGRSHYHPDTRSTPGAG